MEQREIEEIVGRLYLLIMHQEKTIAELRAQLPAPKPATVLAMATPRDADG